MNIKASQTSSKKLPGGINNQTMKEFDQSAQAELFSNLKQVRFSGQLVLKEPKGDSWTVYVHLGYVLYATGGIHPVKRWYRNLRIFLPEHTGEISQWESEISGTAVGEYNRCWQYELLCSWVKQGKITREQATKIVWANLLEVWFDLTQKPDVTYELIQAQSSSEGIVLLDGNRLVAEVARKKAAWDKARLSDYSPNQAPIIRDIEQLQERTSPTVFQMLSQMINGQKTLRDMALEMKRELPTVINFLLPYVQSGLVELDDIPDQPAPLLAASATSNDVHKPLIACVDDSPLISQSLEKFLSKAGYRFVGINDPLRAFSVLLALKPDLIFLDLMMPNTNGYEVCEKLRRIPLFRNTPIVILTGNDGVIDRVRTKMVGATDFLSKAKVDGGAVLDVLEKHLRHCTLSQLHMSQSSGNSNGQRIA